MGLTQVSTDGVKNDAITKTKIPANQIEASELADNAVDTAAIADDAVTQAKIAAGAIGTTELSNNAVTTAKILDDNITQAKMAVGAIGTTELSNNAVTTAKIADGNVTKAKIENLINNNADNKVITGSGTANTLEGESNLTFTSNVLKVQNGVSDANDSNLLHAVAGGTATRGIMIGTGRATGAANNDGMGYIDAIDSESNGYGAQLQFRVDGTRVVNIGYNGNDNVGIGEDYPLKKLTVAADTNTHALFLNHHNNYDDGWGFQSDSSTGHLRLDRSIGNNFNYRRICFHGDGGIAFQGDTAAANALDDYEEGNFSVTVANGGTVSSFTHNKCSYTKIGRLVYFQLYLQISGSGTSNTFRLGNFPFTSAHYINNGYGAAYLGYQNNVFQNSGDLSAYFSPSSTILNFYESNGQPIQGNSANIFGNRDFIIVGSYITA